MGVEYSEGYKQRARERLEQLESMMTPKALEFSKLVSEAFDRAGVTTYYGFDKEEKRKSKEK
jgi:hypothetical protein